MKKGILFFNKAIDPKGYTAQQFIEEFKQLESNSSEIEIRINSSGGSVLHGWSIVDVIKNAKVPVTGIVTGVAASMASVILAACPTRQMLSYASIMMHNPIDPNGKDTEQQKVFAEQLIDFYSSALSLHQTKIRSYMNGVNGNKGTWFNADEALQAQLIMGIQEISLYNKLDPFKAIRKSKYISDKNTNLLEAMVDYYQGVEHGTIEGLMAKIDMTSHIMHRMIDACNMEDALSQIQLNNQSKRA
ncbi:MAG: Clp protease ClpP [Reichenbachiella sp.]